MAAGEGDGLALLRAAYSEPWLAAAAWRRTGGRVAGVIGRSVPREIIAAGGLLPVRLAPLRLAPGQRAPIEPLPPALARELAPGPARVLAALLAGALGWIDVLVIGRDSEADTKLFYVLRELKRRGEATRLPPFAFCDGLRTPARTSARYNRIRARELIDTVAAWTGRRIGDDDLRHAARESARTARQLGRVAGLDAAAPGGRRLCGADVLMAAGAAQILPPADAEAALSALAGAGGDRLPIGHRVFVTGSGQDDLWAYEAIEAAGLAVVGEDHEWGAGALVAPADTTDPLDGIVDAYHLSVAGAARAGLHERAAYTAGAVAATGADAVLQIIFDHDEASGWETPALRARLGADVPVLTARLTYGERRRDELAAAISALQSVAVPSG